MCAQAPQTVTTKEVILAPGHCVNWMALGSCKRSGCSYKHDQAVRAKLDKIKHFIKVMLGEVLMHQPHAMNEAKGKPETA